MRKIGRESDSASIFAHILVFIRENHVFLLKKIIFSYLDNWAIIQSNFIIQIKLSQMISTRLNTGSIYDYYASSSPLFRAYSTLLKETAILHSAA